MKKFLIIIGIITSFVLVFLTGCSSDRGGENSTSLTSDFSSIMQQLSENYEVRAINSYSTDAIPHVDGYEFKVDGKSFKVLKMQDDDFKNFNLDSNENDFLKNIELAKNNSKPYIGFIEKGGDSEILNDFKNIDID